MQTEIWSDVGPKELSAYQSWITAACVECSCRIMVHAANTHHRNAARTMKAFN